MIKMTKFKEIKKLKEKGLNKNQVAVELNLNYRTVKRYWEMTENEFLESEKKLHQKNRRGKICRFEAEIVALLRECPMKSAAQIHDNLEEMFMEEIDFSERTTRRYVDIIRDIYDIPKPKKKRNYRMVPESEIGYQAQVDFGEVSVKLLTDPDRRKKLYFFAMSLSYSRYKFIWWQEHPFTTQDVISAHEKAFEYFGGIPQEIVYDQDSTIVVAENHGEIIFTTDFYNYLNTRPFKTYVCRGADPESKGKIENVIQFTKNNYARGRRFSDIDEWNHGCQSWLDRRANGKVHAATKKIPAELFEKEQAYLQPIGSKINVLPEIIPYNLRKDNTLAYRSNFYAVPPGTYNRCPRVNVRVNEGRLYIFNPRTSELIQVHEISEGKGEQIGICENWKPGLSSYARGLKDQLLEAYRPVKKIGAVVKHITREMPRYAADQFKVLLDLFEKWQNHLEILDMAVEESLAINLPTAGTIRNLTLELAQKEGITNDQINYSYYQQMEEERLQAESDLQSHNELLEAAMKIESDFYDEIRRQSDYLKAGSLQDE